MKSRSLYATASFRPFKSGRISSRVHG
ncbi:aldo/keto reductase, partial [Helicobacter pylori]